MRRLKSEREVIKKFVLFYNKQNTTNFLIDRYPEDYDNTPEHKRIDAIYRDKSETIAIEHTSLDSYIDQRKETEEFKKALSPLRDELKNKLPTPGYYSLAILPDCDMPKKIKWDKFRTNMCNEIIKKANMLELPKPGRLLSLKIKMDNISFEFYLCRHSSNDKLNGNFYISKFGHESGDLDKQKEIIVEEALQKKNRKLVAYNNANCKTVLLFELTDYDWDGIYRSFSNIKEKFSCSQLPAEIYVINTSFPLWWCSSLKKGDSFTSWDEFIKYDEINKEVDDESFFKNL